MSDQTENPEQPDPALDAEVDSAALEAQEALEAEDAPEPLQFDADGPDLEAEIAELKDQVLRAKAEVENTRRIATRDKQDAMKYALTNFTRDILRVADNLGFAMMSVSEDARKADPNLDNLYVGIDMTMKELLSVFGAHNIKPVAADGQAFDHNVHEAVQQVEDANIPANTVMKTLRGGYTLHDRLLRPAQVIVSTGGPKVEAAPVSEPDAQADASGPGQHVDQET